jgi:predicted transposase/invertase (TIGR01784 family)
VHTAHNDKVIPGFEFVFIELPKFKAQKIQDKKLSVLWLRFLSEIKDDQEDIPNDFYEFEDIKQALDLLKESSYTKGQLETYDKYWDSISTEKTLILDSYDEGKVEGLVEGEKIGEQKGLTKVIIEGYKEGFTISQLVKITKLPEREVTDILRKNGL